MKIFKISLKIAVVILSVIIFSALAVAAWYFVVTSDVSLDESKLVANVPVCVIFDDTGRAFDEKATRNYVSIKDVPEITKNAFIAVEDKRFYSHKGVDVRGIVRAAFKNVFSGGLKEGGSTISQQLVKNTLLSGEKTIERKFKEIKLAGLLEKKYSKNEILEFYLNAIYFGKGVNGISDAAQRYFGKNVSELDAAESAMLAGIIKSPRKYNPVDNIENSLKRKDLVLRLMKEQNMLSESKYQKFKNKDIKINFETNYETHNSVLDYVKQLACEKLSLEKETELKGYKIYTSLNRQTNSFLVSPSDYKLSCDYSIVVADAEKKKIVALASSSGDLKRCPASAAKPWLIYAPAIEEKIISEATKIKDEKINYGGYSPSNPDGKFHGYISAKEALAKSYNIPSVKLADSLGFEKIKEYSKKLNVEFDNEDLSVALGNLSGGITLSSLVSCYSPFVNNGKYSKFEAINKIVNPKGKVVYEYEKDADGEKDVFSDSTAFMINDMLSETVKSGTAKKLSSLPYRVCAKTGTNGNKQGNTDAYCIAYTTKHIVGVWLGNAGGKKMDNTVSGGNYPTLMVKDIFEMLYKNNVPKDFSVPDSIEKVYIAKDEYAENQKILVTDKNDKNSLSFYFAKTNLPTEKYTPKIITPIIKDCKIEYKNKEILISVEVDKDVGFYVLDDKKNKVFKLDKSGNYVVKNLAEDTEYDFFVLPFTVNSEGEEIEGELKKLPTVKTDGRKKTIQDTPWWED